jgi:hypothetical protein
MATQSRGRRILGLALAAVVAFAAAKLAGSVVSGLLSPSFTAADMEAELDKFQAFRLIKQHAPEEYKNAAASLVTIANTKGRESISKEAIEVGSQLRRKYADRLATARPEALKAYLDDLIAMFRVVQKDKGNQVCATFAQKGGIVLAELAREDYKPMIDKQGALLWEAILLQPGSATPRAPATDAEWGLVGDAMVGAGATQAQIDAVAGEKYQDPAYCDGLIRFMEAAASLPGEVGDRVRASMLIEISKA